MISSTQFRTTLLIAGALAAPFIVRAAVPFSAAVKLTDASEKFQLSRNPNGALGFDSDERLHLVFWSGRITGTLPGLPSYIYYQNWTEVGGWTTREFIDNSTYSAQHYGGRNPSLAIGPDDAVTVVWHDHRHSNPSSPGNGIDNIEIYADKRQHNGSFSATDIRLTTSSAGHLGDNGYMPKIVAAPSGVLSVIWYDFNADYSISDIYVKHSNASGVFNTGETMASMQLTNLTNRGNTPEYTIPDIAVDASGDLFGIWTTGVGGTAPGIFATIENPGGIGVSGQFAAATAGFFDPPHATTAPNGDLWIAFTDESGATKDVRAVRKPAGSNTFDSPITIKGTASVERGIDLEVSTDNKLHVVWVDERAGKHVYYGKYDPDTSTLVEEEKLTTSDLKWERPTIALDSGNRPFVVWEENTSSLKGDIWFAWADQSSDVPDWERY